MKWNATKYLLRWGCRNQNWKPRLQEITKRICIKLLKCKFVSKFVGSPFRKTGWSPWSAPSFSRSVTNHATQCSSRACTRQNQPPTVDHISYRASYSPIAPIDLIQIIYIFFKKGSLLCQGQTHQCQRAVRFLPDEHMKGDRMVRISTICKFTFIRWDLPLPQLFRDQRLFSMI
jgi:hypothetical protein